MNQKYLEHTNGFGIIEIIVGMSLFITIAVVGVTTVIGSFSTNRLGDEETKAMVYAQQGIEAARSIKNQGWDTPFLATTCTSSCGISSLSGTWQWLGTGTTSGNFTRTITVSDVQRNGSGDIVLSGGSIDSNTKKVTSLVTWNFTPTRNNSVSLVTYLTNFRKVVLGNWALPQLESSFDFTAGNSGAASATAISVAYANNYALVGRASSAGRELLAMNVTNTAAPTLCANCQAELGGNVNDIIISNSYAYLASSNNSQELQIVNVSSPTSLASAPITSFNLTNANDGNDNADATALGITGNSLYLIRAGGNEFVQFNISTPTSPTLVNTNASFVGVPSDMVLVGNYAYVTSSDNSAEIQVFNLTTLSRDATFNLNSGNNNADALSIAYAGNNRVLVGRAASAAPELYSISISNPLSPTVASTVEVGNNVVSVSFGNNLIFVATNNNSADLLIINGSNLDSLPALPAFGQLNTSNSPQDITYEPSIDRVFTASSNANSEFEVIKPQ